MLTDKQLKNVYLRLKEVADEIALSPDWCESTAKGLLAGMDSDTIRNASMVVHRLSLWRQYPYVSPESYLPPVEESPGLEVVESS